MFRCRLPLVQCTQKFASIDASYKDSMRDMIIKYAEKFGWIFSFSLFHRNLIIWHVVLMLITDKECLLSHSTCKQLTMNLRGNSSSPFSNIWRSVGTLVFSSIPSHNISSYFRDRWPYFAGKHSWGIKPPPRSTQPFIPLGPLNRVPASAIVKAGKSPMSCVR